MQSIFNKLYSVIILWSQLLVKDIYLILFSIIFPLLTINYGHHILSDGSTYINEAIYLINGNLYDLYTARKIMADSRPITSSFSDAPYLYNLGLPYLLTPVLYLFGLNFIALKLYLIFFWVVGIFFLKKNLNILFPNDKKIILLVLLLTIISYSFFYYVDNIHSDISFLCFFNIWLYLNLDKKFQNNIFYLLLNGCVLFFSYLIRPTGLVLFLSYIAFHLYYFKNLRNNYFKHFIPVCLFIGFYFLYKYFYPYDFSENTLIFVKKNLNIIVFIENIIIFYSLIAYYYTEILFEMIFSYDNENDLYIIFYYLLIGLILIYNIFIPFIKNVTIKKIKIWIQNKNFIFLIIIILAIYGLYLIIPHNIFINKYMLRYLFPTIPFISFFIFKTILDYKSDFRKKMWISVFFLIQFIYLLLIIFITHSNIYKSKLEKYQYLSKATKEAFNYIKTNTKETDTIIFRYKEDHLLTNRIFVFDRKKKF